MNDDAVARMAAMRPTFLDGAYQWFHRLVACFCLAMGIYYWIRLLGFYPGLLWRFDLMPLQWQVACVVLAVLYPFASVGLWLIASWGPVIWFLCAGSEVVMFVGLPGLFGSNDLLPLVNMAIAVAYIALRGALYLRDRERE